MNEPRSPLLFIWIGVGALIVAGAVIGLMSTVFHTATVEATVLEWKSDVSGTYTAGGDAPLTYTLITASESASRTVPATGSVEAKDHASGTIVVSNLYSPKPQRLITNTRFETPEGKVYRIHSPITVPGYTMKGGQKVAGTIEALVYADAAGEAYNRESATFKLPGLKGSNQYDLITAKTVTALSGGFVGKRATVEKSIRDQAVLELKAELERTLRDKVAAAVPAQSTVFADALQLSYVEAPDTSSGTEAEIRVDGTVRAPAFPTAALTRELASRAAISTDATLTLANSGELAFALTGALGTDESAPLSFTLSGMGHLKAEFSTAALQADLAGTSKSEAELVRAKYTSLVGPLEVSVYPFWLSTLPKNPERITVEVRGALDLER